MPFCFLNAKSKNSNVDFYSIYDGDTWLGFTYCVFVNDLVYVTYLAIDDTIRSKEYFDLMKKYDRLLAFVFSCFYSEKDIEVLP